MNADDHAVRRADLLESVGESTNLNEVLANVTQALDIAQARPREFDPSNDQTAALASVRQTAEIVACLESTDRRARQS